MRVQRIVLEWPSFGPYHAARLRACVDAAPDGVEVLGVAVAGQVDGRPWIADEHWNGLQIETLFPDAMYHQLPGSHVRAAMTAALNRLSPIAVGVSGYGMVDSRAALRWCRNHQAVRVLMTESKADDAPRVWWKEALKRRLVGQFDSALCGGTPHRNYLLQLGMPASHIFDRYDVVDNDRFRNAADSARQNPARFSALPGLNDARPYFLVSSRFIPRKNLSRLLAAFADYRRRYAAGWRLVILGTGPLEGSLREQVAHDAIPDVTFAGFQQFDQLVAYYAFAGAMVHPALQEQWGLVVNEAMACGLPILVSTTVGAAQDLVANGDNGFTFDPEDKGQMCEALEKVSSNTMLREQFAKRSVERIRDWTPRHFGKNFWNAVECANRSSL